MSIGTPGLQAGGRIEASRMALHLVRSAAAGMLSSIPTSASRALGSRNSIGAAARPASPTAQSLRLRPHRPPRCFPGHGRQSKPHGSEAVVLPDVVGRFSLVRHGLRVVDEGSWRQAARSRHNMAYFPRSAAKSPWRKDGARVFGIRCGSSCHKIHACPV